jgi:carotenoid cleavage dioxygenase-like enzyme
VYYVADAAGAIVRETPVTLNATTIVHDCLLTELSFVLIVAPLIFDLQAIMRGKPAFRYEPERGTEIIIIDRADPAQPPRQIMTDGFYFWHYLNGYERPARSSSIWWCTRRWKVRSAPTDRCPHLFG